MTSDERRGGRGRGGGAGDFSIAIDGIRLQSEKGWGVRHSCPLLRHFVAGRLSGEQTWWVAEVGGATPKGTAATLSEAHGGAGYVSLFLFQGATSYFAFHSAYLSLGAKSRDIQPSATTALI